MSPTSIETASGESFIADKMRTVNITLQSDLNTQITDLPITLQDVIYAPKLKANLLSVGQMMNANVDVIFSQIHSSLSTDDCVLAHGMKISNLFAYNAIPSVKLTHEIIGYSSELLEATLWHYRLAHASYNTLEKMERLQLAEGFSPDL